MACCPNHSGHNGGNWHLDDAAVYDHAAARLERWVAGFEQRHGAPTLSCEGEALRLVGADGATASPAHPWGAGATIAAFAGAVLAPRRVGVLLVRRGGYACAVVDDGRVTASKVGHRYVQGRTAAGGW